jgi:uncharacterized protein with HEPN domain
MIEKLAAKEAPFESDPKFLSEVARHLMRARCNRLVRAYFSVDPQIVWDTIYQDLLPLVPL